MAVDFGVMAGAAFGVIFAEVVKDFWHGTLKKEISRRLEILTYKLDQLKK